ncbi:PREDICTED: extensin-like [Nelumbo nucifera]|uniref:X8 domain-containing protein n=2 Tax=Nelumbo nucifera TaxID=4432 RepID=A0A822YN78_NELNU|nr:PREDICTED: extensin-like [Nelumbo nucifera]DAD32759.1 TPA_asm: hypothetical protein HUJ06_011610 [Nelumbo nucifera]
MYPRCYYGSERSHRPCFKLVAFMRAASLPMAPARNCMMLCISVMCFSITTARLFTHDDARRPRSLFMFEGPKRQRNTVIEAINKLKLSKHFDYVKEDPTTTQTYDIASPFNLPPLDSLAPIPLPENTPPFCVYPPFTPQPPTTTIPTPTIYPLPPPPPPASYMTPIFPIPNPPDIIPSPPSNFPSPPESVPSPPESGLTPPIYIPSPPGYVPRPPIGFVPSPPIFLPPIVFPPPSMAPPPYTAAVSPLWCIAKPTVPELIIQEAIDYACGSGADCGSIQPNGPCFLPDTLFAHASYAFNSYWQRTKAIGGTCDFGGTAMLVTVDPSFDGCHFIYY